MPLTFPAESDAYRVARTALFDKEIALRRAIEDVAQARRALPPGGPVPENYAFHECDEARVSRTVPFTDLFGDHDTLVVYSYMFGPDADPCPMCTPLLDGLNGVEDHVRQRLSLVVVAESSPERLWEWRRRRGWQRLRLVSSAGTTYNRDYHGRTSEGHDTTMLNVFHRSSEGIRHFWGTEIAHGPEEPGQHHRRLDTVNPVFNLFDMTPEGRGDFTTSLDYADQRPGSRGDPSRS
jgi:predicted dithiol-disulfide oxidoreductase (DUF899 family)